MAKMRHGMTPARSNLLKKDRAFKEELLSAYNIKEAPAGLSLAVEKAINSLPDEMPVRRRPVMRAVRSFAGCAAVLALIFVGLLGLNTSYPQLTEALPGLGPVFAAINGERTPPPKDEEQTDAVVRFEPVSAESHDNFIGDMTVTDAWSDGKSLCLQMQMKASKEMYMYIEQDWEALYGESMTFILHGGYYETDKPLDDAGDAGKAVYKLSVESGGESFAGEGSLSEFVITKEGEYYTATGCWQMDISSIERPGSELKVSLSLPVVTLEERLLASGGGQTLIQPGYEASFTVPVDTSKNRLVSSTAVDNGCVLKSLDYAPGRVEVTMDIPYAGRLADLLVDFGDQWSAGGDGEMPLNVYPELGPAFSVDGVSYELDGYENSWKQGLPPESQEMLMQVRFVFKAVYNATPAKLRKGPGALRLTVYETPEYMPQVFTRRVAAEFEIDLSTGRAAQGREYEEQWLSKSNMDYGLSAERHGDFVDGVLVCGVENKMDGLGNYWLYTRLVLAIKGNVTGYEFERLMINGYKDGLICKQYCLTDYMQDDYIEIAENSVTRVTVGNDEYYLTTIYLYPMTGKDPIVDNYKPCDRLELVDIYTGAIIISDLEQAFVTAAGKAIGGVTSDAAKAIKNIVTMPERERLGQ